ncbi:Hpt domain protein [Metarhizium robertsii]|uniref:Signal transduction histidine kinase, phosphotransfer (Hpt) domain protein n=2 Tax=Metarhizium robertsii TaxID=568076 RepID=E9EZB2_METRA|nr:Signal transduction histidine kinase, phosphotransfer (Hpt) domain protein [Metarhizium robertsii ARSEF 23]EFY99303.1 Signal transduction histidine kinase, phosphotransfer (Hpt) domain protein [Metarhizium robertsii ARSEF 23]EXV04669.1 Hpt domain protein [Metarhizium robertsii]
MSPTEDKTGADGSAELNFGDAIDMNTFDQILEMDDPGNDDFSSSIVFGFFTQAQETFDNMDTALTQKDLKTLSELGHFLKGSSATLGLVKVRDGCEKIQRYGKNENLDGSSEPDSELCLKRITEALVTVKADYQDVEGKLKAYYAKDDEA